MTDQLLDELLARSAEQWDLLRQSAPLQWARDRRRCLFDSPEVADAPESLRSERADPKAETVRLDAIEAHGQYRAQARLWGRDHRQTDYAFERYDALLGVFQRLSERARMPKFPGAEEIRP
jgi:hypothetical protein